MYMTDFLPFSSFTLLSPAFTLFHSLFVGCFTRSLVDDQVGHRRFTPAYCLEAVDRHAGGDPWLFWLWLRGLLVAPEC